MGKLILESIFILGLPIVVFLGGGLVLSEMSGRGKRIPDSVAPADRKPINRRLTYDAAAVQRYWKALDDAELLGAEHRFLEMDLAFPFLYCGAFAVSLLTMWASLGRPFSPAWIVAPLLFLLLADWTENLTQLRQMKRYMAGAGLQADWIKVASTATLLKILLFYGVGMGLLALVVLRLFKH